MLQSAPRHWALAAIHTARYTARSPALMTELNIAERAALAATMQQCGQGWVSLYAVHPILNEQSYVMNTSIPKYCIMIINPDNYHKILYANLRGGSQISVAECHI